MLSVMTELALLTFWVNYVDLIESKSQVILLGYVNTTYSKNYVNLYTLTSQVIYDTVLS